MYEKKGQGNVIVLLFIFIALIIGTVMMIYTLGEVKNTHAVNSTFYNTTERGMDSFEIIGSFIWVLSIFFALVMILWVIFTITKNSGGYGNV